MTDILFVDVLQRIWRGWWIIMLGMIVGGFLGWGFTRLYPPIYEAQAVFYVGFDANQYVLDQGSKDDLPLVSRAAVMTTVQDIFFAKDVLDNLRSRAEEQGYTLTDKKFYRDFNVQRIDVRWLLLVRATDPRSAADLANLWGESALPILQEAYNHAVELRALELELSTVNKCFAENNFTKGNQCASTQFEAPSAFEQYVTNTQARINQEREASRGLDANLELEFTKPARPPVEPALYHQSAVIVAGILIGLIIGGMLVQKISVRMLKNDHP